MKPIRDRFRLAVANGVAALAIVIPATMPTPHPEDPSPEAEEWF